VTLPRFEPASRPTVTFENKLTGKPEERVDTKHEPHCAACGDVPPLDVSTGLCRPCWRVCCLARVQD
jgi:ribosomal protein S14